MRAKISVQFLDRFEQAEPGTFLIDMLLVDDTQVLLRLRETRTTRRKPFKSSLT